MSAGEGHTHEERAPFDWFTALDILVWSAVLLLVVLGAEWAYGAVVRARIVRGFNRHLSKAAAETTTE